MSVILDLDDPRSVRAWAVEQTILHFGGSPTGATSAAAVASASALVAFVLGPPALAPRILADKGIVDSGSDLPDVAAHSVQVEGAPDAVAARRLLPEMQDESLAAVVSVGHGKVSVSGGDSPRTVAEGAAPNQPVPEGSSALIADADRGLRGQPASRVAGE